MPVGAEFWLGQPPSFHNILYAIDWEGERLYGTNLMFFVRDMSPEAVSITLITMPILLPMLRILGIEIYSFKKTG